MTLDTGEEVEIASGSPYAVVRFSGTENPTATFAKAFETIHEGLDSIGARGKAYLEVFKALEECVLWWHSDGTQILRVSLITPIGLQITAKATVLDAQGNVIPPVPIPDPLVHESLTHFRQSQTTDALFDSFRELYLAFENLISWRIPKQRGESDVKWLRRALAAADSQVNLSFKCSPGWSDFANEFYSEIYEDIRCRVFHSKDARQKLYPHRLADRERVSSALQRLGQIVILLYRDWLNVRIPTSGVSYAGFERMTSWLNQDTEILVSSSDLPLQADETLESPAYQAALTLPTNAQPDESQPGLKLIIASVPATVITIETLRRFGLKHQDNLALFHRLEADLTLLSIDQLEVALGLRLRNPSPPKSYFLE